MRQSKPIMNSLMDVDFYKFTMGQFIWRRHKDEKVTFSFRNRTKNVGLVNVLNLGELREELNHVRTLRLSNTDLHYLRGTNEYGDRMFCEEYLQFLKGLSLPEYSLEKDGNKIRLEFSGPWSQVTYWETIALSIINELYTRALLKDMSSFARDRVEAEGIRRLAGKILILRQNPTMTFSDFGTRRRFSRKWQKYVVETLRDEVPKQLVGTSNTLLAMELGLNPTGTCAHELFMVVAGLRDSGGTSFLKDAQKEVLHGWWEEYGYGLSIFLPDTFGSEFFMDNLSKQDIQSWKGFRWDSGNPFAFGSRILDLYKNSDVDPKSKLLIPSDGLDLNLILQLHKSFGERIKVSYGWGTNLTNDLLDDQWRGGYWFGPLSLVVKPTAVNGRGLVKLSDNIAKAIGTPADIERYKVAAEYSATYQKECVY